jgi:hypothetical protein
MIEKAAVNAPQSRRFAKSNDARQSRESRFAGDCGGFSTALDPKRRNGFDLVDRSPQRSALTPLRQANPTSSEYEI